MEEGEVAESAAPAGVSASSGGGAAATTTTTSSGGGGGGLVFMSKAERTRLRAKLEGERAAEERAKEEQVRRSRQEFLEQLQRERRAADETKRQEQVDRKKEEELTQKESEERASKYELEQLKNDYLGVRQDRRKMQKPSEKFRNVFQFEWDDNDDTTRKDYNVVYTQKYCPQLLFGRGFQAGIDVREQRKKNMFYDDLATRRRELLGQLSDVDDLERLSVTKLLPHVLGSNQLADAGDEAIEEPFETVETKPLAKMRARDWRIFREDYNITAKGGSRLPPPPPLRRWEEAAVDPELLEVIEECGYDKPTPIQMQAIPIGLALMDMIGIAETGSGKTCAFMIPLLQYVKQLPRLNDETAQRGPYGLVLAPARELALQICEEGLKFSGRTGVRLTAIVGGRNAEEQGQRLRHGVEVVVATPGRLKDCLDRAYTVLTQCNYVVLDEADRMIDMGLEKEVNEILDQIPSTQPAEWADRHSQLREQAGYRDLRITHMFTATMPPSVEKMAKSYLRSPCVVQVGSAGDRKSNIEQRLEMVHQLKKQTRLLELLRTWLRKRAVGASGASAGGVIVFVNQKKSADVICRALNQAGVSAVSLHGGKLQNVREENLEAFKSQEVNVLVATDVAGRGLDVEDVQLVLNYDMPADLETYTHRIGRTGRAGKQGQAVTFITEDDPQFLVEILKPSSRAKGTSVSTGS